MKVTTKRMWSSSHGVETVVKFTSFHSDHHAPCHRYHSFVFTVWIISISIWRVWLLFFQINDHLVIILVIFAYQDKYTNTTQHKAIASAVSSVKNRYWVSVQMVHGPVLELFLMLTVEKMELPCECIQFIMLWLYLPLGRQIWLKQWQRKSLIKTQQSYWVAVTF